MAEKYLVGALEQYLAEDDDFLDRATRRIELQTVIIARLKEAGSDVGRAEEMLLHFKRSVGTFEFDRNLIALCLGETDRFSPRGTARGQSQPPLRPAEMMPGAEA